MNHEYKEKQREYYKNLLDCPICLCKMGKKNKLKLDCGHDFHYKCLWEWIKINSTCALCRGDIFKTEEIFFFRRRRI